MTIIGIVLIALAGLLSLPVVIISCEVLFAIIGKLYGKREEHLQRPHGPRVTVLIPAHNEEDAIAATVSGIAQQLNPLDRLIVIADNCSDATAERARAAHAETIERQDPEHRGKGYALDFGVKYLDGLPPDIVLIVDADCELVPGSINALIAHCHLTKMPAQALYKMRLPLTADVKLRVASFAWTVKNFVRPMGLAALGLPCQLMGTGMAIPWEAIKRIDLATGNIVEDVKMGLELAAAGFVPSFCPVAIVESVFPETDKGFKIQRRRWEVGSLQAIVNIAPVMFLRGFRRLDIALMVMAVDLMVPPLMMLLFILLIGLIVSMLFIGIGSVFPAVLFTLLLSFLVLTLFFAWFNFGRHVLEARDILSLPLIFAQKFGTYISMWRNRGSGWIRTDRK